MKKFSEFLNERYATYTHLNKSEIKKLIGLLKKHESCFKDTKDFNNFYEDLKDFCSRYNKLGDSSFKDAIKL